MTRARLFLAAALVCLPACGDDAAPDDTDAGRPDASAPEADAAPDVDAARGVDAGPEPDAFVYVPVDTDCDGLIDGPSHEGWLGEDLDGDGVVDEGETDPNLFDTDGDGLSDGLERGVATPFDASCADRFVADADPSTTTDPTRVDTDGDGIEDGVEDEDHDGELDPGETDPNDDASPPAPLAQVCAAAGRREVSLVTVAAADLALVLPPASSTVELVSEGAAIGVLGHDASTSVAFVALRVTPADGVLGPLGLEESLRPALASAGALSDRQAFVTSTWDGAPAVAVSYTQASTLDADDHANALAEALAPESTGRLPAVASATGTMQLRALYVLRSATEAVVLVSVAQQASVTGANADSAAAFVAHDFVAGAALGTTGDALAPTCRVLSPLETPRVDVLFVVDDSGSMLSSQVALGQAVRTMAQRFENAHLDWRVALVTSSYIATTSANAGRLRPFTRNVNRAIAWLTENSTCAGGTSTCSIVPNTPEPATCPGGGSEGANGGCWIGLNGTGAEAVLGSARAAVNAIAPGTAPGEPESPTRVRAGAQLVVVIVGDADDQSSASGGVSDRCGAGGSPDRAGSGCVPVDAFVGFFGALDGAAPTNPTGTAIPVHGIVCPSGQACGCSAGGPTCDLTNTSREFNPQPIDGVSQQRHAAVVAATGGVLGSILAASSVQRTMETITRDTIARTAHRIDASPAPGSLRVALSAVRDDAACDASDLPRSTADGHDAQGGAVSFYGACRPGSGGETAVVSFQRWSR